MIPRITNHVDPKRTAVSSTDMTSLKTSDYTPHEPIVVSNDAELATISNRGSGTIDDPFILEGWHITTQGKIHGIHVHDTTKFFLIRNNWIEGGSSTEAYGIFIYAASPGTVTITNNTVQHCWAGIVVVAANFTKILYNTVQFNGASGIAVEGAFLWNGTYAAPDYCLIANNIVSQNFHIGISVKFVINSSISQNLIADNAEWGLYFERSQRLHIAANSFINNKQHVQFYYDIWFGSSTGYIEYTTKSFLANYWSDYRGTGNYTIWQSEGVTIIDQFPLTTPPHHYVSPPIHLFEFFLLFFFLLCVGALSVTILLVTLPQAVTTKEALKDLYVPLIRIGLFFLVIQNTLVVAFALSFHGMPTFQELGLISFLVFHLDLLGLSLVGIGYVGQSTLKTEGNSWHLYGGLALIGWAVTRVITQYVIPFGLGLHEYQQPLDYQTFAFYLVYRAIYEMYYRPSYPESGGTWSGLFRNTIDFPPLILILSFLLAAILLFLGAHYLQFTHKNKGLRLFKWYTLLNLFTVFFLISLYYQELNLLGRLTHNYLTIHLTLLIKIVVLPILGFITFLLMGMQRSQQ